MHKDDGGKIFTAPSGGTSKYLALCNKFHLDLSFKALICHFLLMYVAKRCLQSHISSTWTLEMSFYFTIIVFKLPFLAPPAGSLAHQYNYADLFQSILKALEDGSASRNGGVEASPTDQGRTFFLQQKRDIVLFCVVPACPVLGLYRYFSL